MKVERETKTNAEGGKPQGTDLCVGPICPGAVKEPAVCGCGAEHRIMVETMEVLEREHESKSKEISEWTPSAVVKARNANMIQKVEGARQNCHGSS